MMGQNWDNNGWNMMGGGTSPLAGILLFVFGLLVLVGIVLLVIWAVRASSGGGHGTAGGHRYAGGPGNTPGPMPPTSPGSDEAIAVARRRFAAGEISQEEFTQIMSALSR